MPVTFPPPPTDALATLQQGLQAVGKAQQLDPCGGAAALTVAPTSSVMRPYPVFELGLDDLAAGKGLEAARLITWRYLLVANAQVRQAVEIIPDPRGGQSTFGSLTNGYVAGEEQALRVAEQLPEVGQRTFELRALRVPALYVMALWLKDRQDEQDRFLVMPPTFPPLQALVPHSASDFLPFLHQLARQKAPLEKKVTPP